MKIYPSNLNHIRFTKPTNEEIQQKYNFPCSITVLNQALSTAEVFYYDGEGNEFPQGRFNIPSDYLFQKALLKTDSAPTIKGLYPLLETGIYTNLGGINALSGKLNFASFDGTSWSKVEVAIPDATLSTSLNPNSTTKSETGKSVADFIESLAFQLKTTEGVNLFDKGRVRFQGYIDTTTGVDEVFANSEISPWISVDGGEIYNLSGRNLEAAFNVVFKDANGGILKPQNELGVEFSNFNVGTANLVLKSPETAVAVKFQVKFNGVGDSENVKFEKGNHTLYSKFAEKSKDLFVKFSNGSYYLRSNFSNNNDIRLKIQKSGGNNLFNLTEAKLLGLNDDTVNGEGLLLNGSSDDDIAPIKINDTYIGANHGVSRALTITANGHGKTLSDVGSKWTDADGQLFYLLKVINTNQLLVMSSNRGGADSTWDFKQGVASPLTHHSGAVNTSSISSNSGVLSQLYPSVKNLSQKVFADGNEINREGEYSADVLCFTETYDIIDTPDMLEKLFTSRPSGGYTTQPDFTNGDSLITLNLTYTFRKGLSCVVDWNFIVRKSLKFNYFGAVQSGYAKPQWVSNIMRKYPNSLPISDGSTTWDFNSPKEISGNFAAEMNLTSAYWKNANYPVIRSVDNLNATIKSVSFNIGYLPEFSQSDRKSQVNNAWYLYTSKKQYPYAVDNKIGSILPPNTYRSGSAFRGWSERIGYRFNSFLVNKGNKSYLYLDYADAMTDEIVMPVELIGKKINVLQSENLTVLSDVVTEKLNVISNGNAFADIELI